MKKSILALAAVLSLAGAATTANAVEFNVGPGGVYVGPNHYHRWHRDHWRRSYNRYDECKVIIKHRINRFGERVTVRRRICD